MWQNKYESSIRLSGQVLVADNAEHSSILQTVSLRAVPLSKNVIVAVGKDTCAIYRVPHESLSTCTHVTNITKIYHTL
jgi:hypothetical protein